jgi:hypothetical protein
MTPKTILFFIIGMSITAGASAQANPAKGTFGYDQAFLKKLYPDMITLRSKDGRGMVLVSPQHQGRIMTSTADGLEGISFGWLNYPLLESKKVLPHMTPVGGEERFWLGPEGGQFALYFKKGDPFDFDHWQVPSALDSKPFRLVASTDSSAAFEQQIDLVNYAGTPMHIRVQRKITMLDDAHIHDRMSFPRGASIRVVGFQTDNTITNTGDKAWDEQTGMPSIWLLSMLNPGPHTTVFIPFYDDSSGKKVITDDYFGKVPADRLKRVGNYVFFKADGKFRSKLGIAGNAGLSFAASYDADRKVLTLVKYEMTVDSKQFVNSLWKLQDDPYSGDVINSYNDGPLADGTQMGPFYEIETSSPAARLAPGQSMPHTQRIFHMMGEEKDIDLMTRYYFNLSLDEIKKTFAGQ